MPAFLLCVGLGLPLLFTACSSAHTELVAVDSRAAPENSSGLLPILEAELARVLRQAGKPKEASAVLPASENCRIEDHWLHSENGGDVFGTPVEIHWDYSNLGDYDQNGEVNLADLSSIGQHFGSDHDSPDWDIAARADGDHNGEINLGDVTPIGLNFGGAIDSYVIQATTSLEDAGAWHEAAAIGLAEGVLPDTGGQRRFAVSFPDPGENAWYRIIPSYHGALGEPSKQLAYGAYSAGPYVSIEPASAPSGCTVTITLSSDVPWVSFDDCTWFLDKTWYCKQPYGESITVTLGPPGAYEISVQTPDLSWWGRTFWFTVTPSEALHLPPQLAVPVASGVTGITGIEFGQSVSHDLIP